MMMMMMMMALYKTNQLDSSMDLPDLMTMMDTLQWLKEINDNDYLEIITIDAVNVIIYGQLFGYVILIVNVFFSLQNRQADASHTHIIPDYTE